VDVEEAIITETVFIGDLGLASISLRLIILIFIKFQKIISLRLLAAEDRLINP
jgi:hypothetical protein